jgi:hypothetical protein
MPNAYELYNGLTPSDAPHEMAPAECEREYEKARIAALANLHTAPATIQ